MRCGNYVLDALAHGPLPVADLCREAASASGLRADQYVGVVESMLHYGEVRKDANGRIYPVVCRCGRNLPSIAGDA